MDSWVRAARTYKQNFRHPVVDSDIHSLSAEDFLVRIGRPGVHVDLVAGGPPCQGFSVQRIGADTDARNDLIFEFARFVVELRPQMFLMENVPGLLGKRGLKLARRFEQLLEAAGFVVRVRRVNTAEYGVPQLRKRIFYFGWLRNAVEPFSFPPPTHSPEQYRTVWQAIGDIASPPADCSPNPADPLHRRTHLSEKNQQRMELIPQGGGFESLPVELRVNCHKNGAAKIGHRYVYGRLSPENPAGTITARFDSFTRGKFAHPYEHRNITLREGARLQTFPDTHFFAGSQEEIAALIGNAVPPLIARVLGEAIYAHLSRAREIPARTIPECLPASRDAVETYRQQALFSDAPETALCHEILD
jgi:DNA (cytosine-5)-methyltransferase 1